MNRVFKRVVFLDNGTAGNFYFPSLPFFREWGSGSYRIYITRFFIMKVFHCCKEENQSLSGSIPAHNKITDKIEALRANVAAK